MSFVAEKVAVCRAFLGLLVLWIACALPSIAAAPQEIEAPAWFKRSFLDLREDIREAAAANKGLIVYFGQNGCPYCRKLIEVNFTDKDIVDKTRRHFDAIELNIYGSREVVWLDGKPRSEKDLAAALKVQFTPTLLFLDEKGEIVLRVNGYYPPQRFLAALDYASLPAARRTSFAEFQQQYLPEPDRDAFHDEPFFRKPPYDFDRRKRAARPLAVFFEQRRCADCDEMHATALKEQATRQLLSRFDVYRLDLHGTAEVTTPNGSRTTAARWARDLKVLYSPSVLFFDAAGAEVFRIEAYVRTFHLQSALDYIASGAYRQQSNFQRYIQARAEGIRARGGTVDIMK